MKLNMQLAKPLTAIILATFVGLFSSQLFAQSDIDAQKLASLEAQAKAGNADAQFDLSKRFYYGDGVPKDYSQTLYWLQKSVAQNNRRAELQLSKMYDAGVLLQTDRQKSLYWLTKSADQGLPAAEAALGTELLTGYSVKKSSAGLNWLLSAANKGDKTAQAVLPGYYAYGIHVGLPVPLDYKQSLFWALVAMKTGVATGESLGNVTKDDESQLDRETVAKIKEQAKSWSPAPF